MLDSNPAQDLFKEATPPANTEEGAARHVNSVDATMGQPIVTRVLARKQELEAVLARLPADSLRAANDIELALTTINDLLTGDLEHVPAVVAADMSRWLEHNKHLAETAVDAIVDPVTAPVLAKGTGEIEPLSSR